MFSEKFQIIMVYTSSLAEIESSKNEVGLDICTMWLLRVVR
jgi:hypothetical protein